ncbi:MAG TPA: hypothetical protein VFI37_08825 [Gaiellaceae bacterium]|jgi:hypothetical protein|nr:hypothetical protein [Gaiellaceae bacterium]
MRLRLILLACMLVAAAVALPASGSNRRAVSFTLYSANVGNKDMPMLISATGAIHAIGSAASNDDVKGSTVPLVFTFPKGKIYATVRVTFNWVPDLATCTATRHGTRPFTITGGTGIYHGITGRGHYLESGAAIGVHATNGDCEQRFKLNYVVARLSGTTNF